MLGLYEQRTLKWDIMTEDQMLDYKKRLLESLKDDSNIPNFRLLYECQNDILGTFTSSMHYGLMAIDTNLFRISVES